MSRIEDAIEAATRQRNSTAGATPPADTVPPAAGRSSGPPPPPSLQPRASEHLAIANAPNSPAAEQYRKLKSVIVNMHKGDRCGRALMITSPVAGEGKTFTAVNLAISLAQEFDHTVLLVDADLRRPSILATLGLEADTGLSDCILDGTPAEAALVATGIDGLTVLPPGRPVDNPVELLASNRMAELFAGLKAADPNRFIVVDTTPLLPFAEPQFIATAVDGVLLVVRENLTSPDKLKQSMEMLKEHNLLGVVSNGVTRTTSLQGYYGYYGYRSQ